MLIEDVALPSQLETQGRELVSKLKADKGGSALLGRLMCKSTARLAAVLTFAAAFVCDPGHAAVMTATFTGTVEWGRDFTGEFGLPLADQNEIGNRYADLSGQAYTAIYVYDTELGTRRARLHSDRLEGGMISASFELNGVVHSFSMNYANSVLVQDFPGEEFMRMGASNPFNSRDLIFELTNTLRNPDVPRRIDLDFAGAMINAPRVGDTFRMFGYGTDGSTITTIVGATLRPEFVTITGQLPHVPEPSSWALMLIGFGATGTLLRTRRQRVW